MLRLVHDERRPLSRPLTLAQEAPQCGEPSRRRLFQLGDSQILEYELDDPVEGQGRVEHERCSGIGVEPLTEGQQQSGLARARWPCENHRASLLLESIKRLAVRGGHEEEARVGSDAERLLVELEEALIHGASWSPSNPGNPMSRPRFA